MQISILTRNYFLFRFLLTKNPHKIYSGMNPDNIPENQCNLLVPEVLSKAHQEFLQREPVPTDIKVVIIMVVQPGERNRIEQRHIEYELADKYQVPLVRASLHDIATFGSLSPNEHLILYVNYFRSYFHFERN
jgi:hypothetical protein